MNELQIIGGTRCYEQDGTVFLNLEDVARGLGFTKTDVKVSETGFRKEYVRIDWARVNKYLEELNVPTCGHDDFIPENIFYRLAMKAKNEVAEAFQAKVADEIIPSIRKHGAYMTADTLEKAMLNPDFLVNLATKLKEETDKRKALEAEAEMNRPKVLLAESIANAENLILIRDLAKILKQNGYDTGEGRLYEQLRNDGYLIKSKSQDRNMPTQRAIDMGLFRVVERTLTNEHGTFVSPTTKVTGKGQMYFVNKYCGKKEEANEEES